MAPEGSNFLILGPCCYLSRTAPLGLRVCFLAPRGRVEIRLKHQVADVDRSLEFADGALRVLVRLLQMLFDHRETFHASTLLGCEDLEDFAGLAFLRAGENDDLIAAFDVK